MGVRSRSTATGAQFALAVTSATVVTLTIPTAAMVAEIYVRTAPVVYTRDGTDPTATKGTPADVGDIIILNSRDELDKFKVIAVSTTAALDVEYFTDVSEGGGVQRITATIATQVVASTTKTREANATPYGVNDVISEAASSGTAWTFAALGRINGGSGYIVKGRVVTDDITVSTMRLRLYLFNATPTSELDDLATNSQPLYADVAKMIGIIDFDALDNAQAGADSAETQRDDLRLAFTCASADADLYGVLVTLDAFTPISGQKFTITLDAETSD